MKPKPRPLAVGDLVTFRVDGDGEILTGRLLELNLPEVDGISTATWDEPVHEVWTRDRGSWAIHPSWIVSVETSRQYALTVRFVADRPLTASELDDLAHTIAVQVEEPMTATADGLPVDATYTTTNVEVTR